MKSYIKLLIYLILTIGLMILISIDKEPNSSFYGILGVVLFILTFNYILRIINVRTLFFRELNTISEKHENFIYTFEFSDDEFSYFDNEKRFHFKWEAFSNYSTSNDFFMLLIDKKIYLMLHKSETNEHFNDIIELIKSKLSFKKV